MVYNPDNPAESLKELIPYFEALQKDAVNKMNSLPKDLPKEDRMKMVSEFEQVFSATDQMTDALSKMKESYKK